MTPPITEAEVAAIATNSEELPPGLDGPLVFDRLRHELPDKEWTTCHGCPSLRVHDFHYFYCRRLGDHDLSDKWGSFGGWRRLWGGTTWSADQPPPCGLAVRAHLERQP